MNLSMWGVKPGGDDHTFFQRVALRRAKLDREKTHAEFNARNLVLGDDFSSQISPGTASGQLVYVGTGWYLPAKNINPYQGIDVKNKIVVIAGGGLPRGVSFRDMNELKEGVDYEAPQTYARKHGAKGLLVIPAPNAIAGWQASLQRLGGPRFKLGCREVPGCTAASGNSRIEKLTTQLFEGEKRDGADDAQSGIGWGDW
jgi:hypothetical protein